MPPDANGVLSIILAINGRNFAKAPLRVSCRWSEKVRHSMHNRLKQIALLAAIFAHFALMSSPAAAHGVPSGDQAYIEAVSGQNLIPFMYLGAKHMVTGYDHLLFLFGVIFFLYRLKDVGLYVTLFAIGHSTTLLFGVLNNTGINAFLIDAIIGLSVVYKALDNLDVFKKWFGFQPNAKAAVLIFGLFHGFGLATKVRDFELSPDGLIPNLVSFNVGVEIGQLLALSAILIVMGFWRRTASFPKLAVAANVTLMLAGIALTITQLRDYFATGA